MVEQRLVQTLNFKPEPEPEPEPVDIVITKALYKAYLEAEYDDERVYNYESEGIPLYLSHTVTALRSCGNETTFSVEQLKTIRGMFERIKHPPPPTAAEIAAAKEAAARVGPQVGTVQTALRTFLSYNFTKFNEFTDSVKTEELKVEYTNETISRDLFPTLNTLRMFGDRNIYTTEQLRDLTEKLNHIKAWTDL